MMSTVAPNTWAWTSLPSAIFPAGTTTTVRRPKRAPYAAAEALVLPVEAQMIARLPLSSALATATTIPRSLKEPVGLSPSNLKWSERKPRSTPMLRDSMSGVPPSPRVIRGVLAVSGRCSA